MSDTGNGNGESIFSLKGTPWQARFLLVLLMTVGLPGLLILADKAQEIGWLDDPDRESDAQIMDMLTVLNYYGFQECQFIADMTGNDPNDCVVAPFMIEARSGISKGFKLPASGSDSGSASASSSLRAYGFNPANGWTTDPDAPGRFKYDSGQVN